MDNYIDLTIEEIYEIITSGKQYWPKHMTITDKIELLDTITSYFAERDDFEKCIHLQKIADEIRDTSKAS